MLPCACLVLGQGRLDGTLVSSPNVFQPEGCGVVAECAERRDECRLLLIFFRQGDLVIARVTIQETKQRAPCCGVYDLVYSRQPKGILRAVLIEISISRAENGNGNLRFPGTVFGIFSVLTPKQ